jgi:Meiotically up-regulated gene 113
VGLVERESDLSLAGACEGAQLRNTLADFMTGNKSSPSPGYVYLVKSGSAYKIGRTKGPVEQRLRNLQTGNHSHLSIIKTVYTANPVYLESALHRYFYRYNISGEWFACDEMQVEEIIEKMDEFSPFSAS